MNKEDQLLHEAKEQPTKVSLASHAVTIKTLREKNYSWRDIAEFLNKNGVATDHTKVFRFMKNWNDDANNFIDFFVPSAEQYVEALRESPVADPTTDRAKAQRQMLLFHLVKKLQSTQSKAKKNKRKLWLLQWESQTSRF